MKSLLLSSLCLAVFTASAAPQQQQKSKEPKLFRAELFLNDDDINAGLYDGTVKGRPFFGGTQVPHGQGIINYFTNDKFHRLNYTGEWKDGQREGKGTTYFRDGSVYTGDYLGGVEDGRGVIRYSNGNVLEGGFRKGKIHGHAVFRYPNGNRREGFFRDNVLDGRVIFSGRGRRQGNGDDDSGDGSDDEPLWTVVEVWRDGRRVEGGDTQVSDKENEEDDEEEKEEKDEESSSSSDNTTNEEDSPTTLVDLGALRESIRRGDKAAQEGFFFRRPKQIRDHEKDPSDVRKRSQLEDRRRLRARFNRVQR